VYSVAETSRSINLSIDLITSTQYLSTGRGNRLSVSIYSYTAEVSVTVVSFDYTYRYMSTEYMFHRFEEHRELEDEELAKLLNEIAEKVGKKIDVYLLARIIDEDRKER